MMQETQEPDSAHTWLERDTIHTLTPSCPTRRLTQLGVVEAGFPSPAEEERLDTMSLDEYLITNREASYILRVSGDSMLDAGILPGDMVIVERTATPRDGDIVIAEVDGEWTLKFFRKRGGQVFLEAANKEFEPILPQHELTIVAVVKAVVRKY